MIIYQTKSNKLPGTSLTEVTKQARRIFHEIEKRSKRKAHIRSAYFDKEKIFFDYFWGHLHQKNPKERFKRLKYFMAAIDLIENSHCEPTKKQNPNKNKEMLYRFTGKTKEKETFCVQIKENTRSKAKYLMSMYSSERNNC